MNSTSALPPKAASTADAPATPPPQGQTSWLDVVRPRGLLDLAAMWFASRNFRLLVLGLPFAVLAVAGVAYVRRVQSSPPYRLIPRYEAAFSEAVEAKEYDEALVLLKGLAEMAPNEPRHQYRRALLLLEHKVPAEALPLIQALTPPDAAGYAPARLWLVDQALSKKPEVPLDAEALIAQLRRATAEEPLEPTAHQLLAKLYIDRGELRLAESQLIDVVARVPQLHLPLARIQRDLGRSPATVAVNVEAARDHFRRRLAANERDVEARLGWAQSLLLEQKIEDGEAVLREGIAHHDAPELHRGLADYLAQAAALRWREAPNNPQAVVALVESALAENPFDPLALDLLINLYLTGAQFQPGKLAPAIDSFQQPRGEPQPGSASPVQVTVALAAALGASGEPARGAELLAPLLADEPRIRPLLMQLYRAGGNPQAAQALAEAAAEAAAKQLVERPQDAAAVTEYAERLLDGERFDDAYETLKRYLGENGGQVAEQSPPFRALVARSCLGRCDRLVADQPQDADLQLLEEALATGQSTDRTVARLASLALGDVPASAPAEALLMRLAASGDQPTAIYVQLGTAAWQAKAWERSVRYLERALASASDDPVIKNNLAEALMAWDPGQADRAMGLANEALEQLPGHPSVLTTRAGIYLARQQWKEASLDLIAALPYQSDNPSVHQMLSKAYGGLGETQLAEEHARRATALEAAQAAASGDANRP